MWQIVAFRYIFHEVFWGLILWGYRVLIRNCIGLETGGEALLMGRVVTAKAIYARFLLVQLKGFGQIIAINFFDALMTFFMRAVYVIYDEWFMQLQYGYRASKALISTEEENYLRTFEAQAETFASAPSVFITGGLLLFGHFQPVVGQTIVASKVIIDIVVQLITNFVADWVSLSSIDRPPQKMVLIFGYYIRSLTLHLPETFLPPPPSRWFTALDGGGGQVLRRKPLEDLQEEDAELDHQDVRCADHCHRHVHGCIGLRTLLPKKVCSR